MILHVASDIHFEHMNSEMREAFFSRLEAKAKEDGVKVLVLAGDIGSMYYFESVGAIVGMKEHLDRFQQIYEKVLYTPGNHEFFGTSMQVAHHKLREYAATRPRFGLLLPEANIKEAGLSFTGGTLWYPDPEDESAYRWWIDYRKIIDSEEEIANAHRAFLADVPGDVVVSHHYPTDESVGRWVGNPNNCFFSARIDQQIEIWAQAKLLPKLWIHGHTHDPIDVMSKFGYRVYCNPYGYPSENANPAFWDRLLVEIKES